MAGAPARIDQGSQVWSSPAPADAGARCSSSSSKCELRLLACGASQSTSPAAPVLLNFDSAMTIAEYVKELRKNLAHGDATEHTHRPALKSLLESASKGIIATNEPKRIECGAPDFIITRKSVPLGYIETKDVGTPLDEIERGKGPHGEQFKRYIAALPNWILTDYLEFRWYVAGERRPPVRLASFDKKKKKIQLLPTGEDDVSHLLEAFFTQPALTVESAKDLADRMAGMTRVVRDLIAATFSYGSAKDQKQL